MRVQDPARAAARRHVLVLALVGLLPSPSRAQDPFQPGLRWRAPADVASPAIPRSAVFASGGSLVWTASNGPHPGFGLVSGFENGTATTLLGAAAPPASTGVLSVAAGDLGEALFALVQVARPDNTHRGTLVARYSATAAATGAPFDPVWRFDSGMRANGPARLGCSADGSRVFVAGWNGPTPEVRIDVLDAANGQSLAHTVIFASSFNEMSVAAGGARAALACGTNVWIVDGACARVHREVIPLATSAVSLSGDGATCAIGGALVRVIRDQGQGYAPLLVITGNPGEVATRLALSRDGRTLGIGWWNAVSGVDVRFEVWDVPAQARLFQTAQNGPTSGLQNAPECVRVTADGERVAFGCWGDGTTAPEVLVWDRASNALVLQADTGGSVFALDLDASGTRIVVGQKSVHANELGSSGEFRLYDTGERELAVLRPPRVGGSLDLAARVSGASVVFFLVSARPPVPSFVPGLLGTLALDRSGLFAQRGPADATGRLDLSIPIQSDPTQIGTYRHLQAAFLVNGTWSFGTTVIDALVL